LDSFVLDTYSGAISIPVSFESIVKVW